MSGHVCYYLCSLSTIGELEGVVARVNPLWLSRDVLMLCLSGVMLD